MEPVFTCSAGDYVVSLQHPGVGSETWARGLFTKSSSQNWMQTDLSWSEVMELMLRKIGDYFLNAYVSKDGMHKFF